jgi:hypothetical protein
MRGLKWYDAVSSTPSMIEQHTLQLDAGLIYVNTEIESRGLSYHDTISFKPTTKLINILSYGIPCLCVAYESYKEIIKKEPELEWLIIKDLDHAFSKIDKMRSKRAVLERMSDLSYNVANQYHLDNCSKYYQFR